MGAASQGGAGGGLATSYPELGTSVQSGRGPGDQESISAAMSRTRNVCRSFPRPQSTLDSIEGHVTEYFSPQPEDLQAGLPACLYYQEV